MNEEWRKHPIAPFFETIESMCRRAWSRETASLGDQAAWSEDNPAKGQCAATTAMLFVKVLELSHNDPRAKIMRAVVDGFGSHYWLQLSDGTDIDLTSCQFPEGTVIPPGEERSIEYLLDSDGAKNARTRERMELLNDQCEVVGDTVGEAGEKLGLF